MTAQLDVERSDIVATKVGEWRNQLIDLGFRNTLLYFRRTKTGSLDLSDAEPTALADLEAAERVTLRALFLDRDRHRDACTRARNLSKRINAFDEEQGIDVGRVAFGLVRTNPEQNKGSITVPALSAPLLLQSVTLKARTAAGSEYTIEVSDEPELNSVLLYALESQYGINLEHVRAQLDNLLAEPVSPTILAEKAFAYLEAAASTQGVKLRLELATVVGTFNYEKLAMVEDLSGATDLLEAQDLIAALAGYGPAKETLVLDAANYRLPDIDELKPADEFLIHDADSSQHRAVLAALSGQHVVIEGPPGTGKSQTIANIIAGAAAHGKRVLFVAEKRAAIDAVMNRLIKVGLGGLMFDLHRARASKREVARQLADSLEQVSKEPPVDADETHTRMAASRRRLVDHSRELHATREPWGLSAYEVRARLLDLPDLQVPGAFRGDQLRSLNADIVRRIENDLREFVDLGGLKILRRETPWCNTEIRHEQEVEHLLIELDEVAEHTLRRSQNGLDSLLRQTGLTKPDDIAGWHATLKLLDDVSSTVDTFGSDIFGEKLESYYYATADSKQRRQIALKENIGWLHRRRLVKELRQKTKGNFPDTADLHTGLKSVREQRHWWKQLSKPDAEPSKVDGLEQVSEDYKKLRLQLSAVAASARRPDLESGPAPEVEHRLEELRADKDMLFRVPRLNRWLDDFRSVGLDPFLQEIAQRNLTAKDTWHAFMRVWLTSLEDEFKLRVPEIGQFVPERLTRAAEEFRSADIRHRELAARRVRRELALHARDARNAYPDQALILRQQASRKTRHMSTRRLVEETSDVLLTLRPCWAMSPLIVSRMLPAEQLFDLVIFDEASQIQPHDAITSIMRGKHVVVAGDEKQLPPTDFFQKALDRDDDEDEIEDSLSDYESILTALRPLLPINQTLSWHYRSTDERLIAFSNHEIYDDKLVTFPGSATESPVSFVRVDGRASPGQDGSSPQEVDKVVELALEHARLRPTESLGVIARNIKHQARIERALAEARAGSSELDEFFAEDTEPNRRFFVKNLESVQGDERDAIILSVGIARDATGRISGRHFGPLNYEGAERRVNVAVTRASKRMTVVAAFSAADLSPDVKNGTKLLRRYLDFAQRQGQIEEVGASADIELNGFERSIYQALRSQNVLVHPQWGVSGYLIDFALAHRAQPGRMVLAVEADGHRYHSSASARDRDRLRQAHLERLGWRFHRVWSSAWFQDPVGETDKILLAWNQATLDADLLPPDPAPTTPAPPSEPAPSLAIQRGPRPNVPSGLKTQEYSDRELVAVCRWLTTDGLHLDREERLTQAMAELGFKRRGPRIIERLMKAVEIAERLADEEK